jgi:uncharacterized protein YigE (DUF2233 family)
MSHSCMMRCLIAFSALLLAGCRERGPSSGVTVSSVTSGGIEFSTVDVDLSRAQLNLVCNDKVGRRLGNFDSLQRYFDEFHQRLLFATNAGIFDPKFVPCGLTVIDGKEQRALNLQDGVGNFYMKPNGVFTIVDGRPVIVDSTLIPSVKGHIQLATQSGPLLVSNGVINPQFKTDSQSRRIRSGVGVRSNGSIVFALSGSPVTFDEFARLFRDSLHCGDALYLDGTISQFYVPGKEPPAASQDFAAMLAVTTKD